MNAGSSIEGMKIAYILQVYRLLVESGRQPAQITHIKNRPPCSVAKAPTEDGREDTRVKLCILYLILLGKPPKRDLDESGYDLLQAIATHPVMPSTRPGPCGYRESLYSPQYIAWWRIGWKSPLWLRLDLSPYRVGYYPRQTPASRQRQQRW